MTRSPSHEGRSRRSVVAAPTTVTAADHPEGGEARITRLD
jgi:hypothetical protein